MNRTVRTNPFARNQKPAAASALSSGPRFELKGLAVCLMLAFGSQAHALPVGGSVAAGGATIASSANSMTINQSTQNVAINWQSFSIGQGQGVQFVQPSTSAVALNRVLGQDPSSILGSLSANGKVFLVNPNGILFGAGSQVNVGGLIASTRNITDADFMAGRHKFAGTGGGDVVNQGSITAAGGQVALLGANVSNDGVIVANMGSVALVAGNAMTLDLAGDGLLSVSVDEGAVNAMVRNGGLIRANGGNVILTAQGAGTLLRTTVNNTGIIEAQSIQNRNGTIRLMGDMPSGTVSNSGTLDASGRGAGQTGGSVTATAHHVGLFGGHIDASGDAGGGTVLIGGGFQGNNAAVQSASATYMSPAATIAADAITHGNGGTVVLWSDDSTRAQGSITARGGAQGGNGGLVETSSGSLDVVGIRVTASAPNGNAGLWLLDPADVTIGVATVGATQNGTVFSPNSGVSVATVGVADLRAALEAGTGTNITITTTNTGAQGSGAGNITIASALTWDNTPTGGNSTLTLNAAADVNINAAVTATRGSLVVCCGQDINVREAITTTNGSVLLTAGRDINVIRSALLPATDITVTNGNLTMCAGGDILLSNQLNAPTALLTVTNGSVDPIQGLNLARGLVLSAGNDGTGPGAAAGTVTFTAGTMATVTAAPTTIFYNPVSYAVADRANFAPNITGTAPNQFMLVFPQVADKPFDGTTTATVTGLQNIPAGINVTLTGAGTANFDTAAEGVDKLVTFTGFGLGGADAGLFALPGTAVCCLPAVQRTTGNITAAAVTTSPASSTFSALPFLPLLLAGPFPTDIGLTVGGMQMPEQLVASPPPPPVVVPPPVVQEEERAVEAPAAAPGGAALPPRHDRN